MDKTEQEEAIKIVNELIREEYNRLYAIAQDEESDPVCVAGYTVKDFFVQANISGSKAAQILLDYDYPIYTILKEDCPQDMWDSLAEHVGIASVVSVDI